MYYFQKGYLYDTLILYATEYKADPEKHSKQIMDAFGENVLDIPMARDILDLYAKDAVTSKDKSLGFFTLLALTPYFKGEPEALVDRCCKLGDAELSENIIVKPNIITRMIETYAAISNNGGYNTMHLAAQIICNAYQSAIIKMLENSTCGGWYKQKRTDLSTIYAMARSSIISLWDTMYAVPMDVKAKDVLKRQLLTILPPIQAVINTKHPKNVENPYFSEKVLSLILSSCLMQCDTYPSIDEFNADIKLIKKSRWFMTPEALQAEHWGSLHEICRGMLYSTTREDFDTGLPYLISLINIIQLPIIVVKYPPFRKSFHNYLRYKILQIELKRRSHKAS